MPNFPKKETLALLGYTVLFVVLWIYLVRTIGITTYEHAVPIILFHAIIIPEGLIEFDKMIAKIDPKMSREKHLAIPMGRNRVSVPLIIGRFFLGFIGIMYLIWLIVPDTLNLVSWGPLFYLVYTIILVADVFLSYFYQDAGIASALGA